MVAAMNEGEAEAICCPLHGADNCNADIRTKQLIGISDNLRNSQLTFTVNILTVGLRSGEQLFVKS
jgi:hypothetical protein